MAITAAEIANYIAEANVALAKDMITVVDGARSGSKTQCYKSSRRLSAGVDVLTSNHGLTNLQVEVIVQKMIGCGNLNDLSSNPIPYNTSSLVIAPVSPQVPSGGVSYAVLYPPVLLWP
jgi:hypothetical protein